MQGPRVTVIDRNWRGWQIDGDCGRSVAGGALGRIRPEGALSPSGFRGETRDAYGLAMIERGWLRFRASGRRHDGRLVRRCVRAG
jgi:hypothetical protein